MKQIEPKAVYIEWCDAFSNVGWMTREEIDEWAKKDKWIIREMGWLVKETKKYFVYALGWKPESGEEDCEQFVNIHKIPKTWILKRIDLTKYIRR